MESQLTLLLLVIGQFSLRWAATRQCPNTSAAGDTSLLVLRSFPGGLNVLSGPRIAQDEIDQSDIISD